MNSEIQVTEVMLNKYDMAVDKAFEEIKDLMTTEDFDISSSLLDQAIHRHLQNEYSKETIRAIDSRYLEWLERNEEVMQTIN